MGKLYNRARMTVSGTPGTGVITLGSAVSGYLSFAGAGVQDGDILSISAEDGANFECGLWQYASSGTTLTRLKTFNSSAGGGSVSFTSGAIIFVDALAADFRLRISSAASGSITVNTDNFDQYFRTALAATCTISADGGNPVDGQSLMFRFLDNGTARTLTWTTGSSKAFRAVGVVLPTTTIINKTLYVGAVYNATAARWDVIAVGQEE